MTVVLRRATIGLTDEEYMDVSYYFHDGKPTIFHIFSTIRTLRIKVSERFLDRYIAVFNKILPVFRS